MPPNYQRSMVMPRGSVAPRNVGTIKSKASRMKIPS